MAKKIVITSGKGGVGKTTVTANLGIFLSLLGKNVLMIDVDFGLNNLDVVLGLENNVIYDLSDVLNGRCRVKQALVQHPRLKNLYFLSSGNSTSLNNLSGQNLKLVLENVSTVFDYILIDCPAGIDMGFHRAVSCADQALVVVTPTMSSLRDANKAISILKSYKLKKVGLVINRARGDLMIDNLTMLPEEIATLLQTELVSVIPDEDRVLLNNTNNLNDNSLVKTAYKYLATYIVKNEKRFVDVTNKYTGFFGSIKKGIRRNL